MEATKRPWKIQHKSWGVIPIDAPGPTDCDESIEVCVVSDHDKTAQKANAELIVRAVNSFDILLGACNMVIDKMTLGRVASKGNNRITSYEITPYIAQVLQQAIKQAEDVKP